MQGIKKFNGPFTPEELKELDSLILELQKVNNGPIPARQQVKNFKQLPEPKNTRLWELLLHVIELIIMCPDNLDDIRKISGSDQYNTIDDYVKELPLTLIPFVMRYVWRRYESSENCGYAFSTAKYAFLNWKASLVSINNAISLEDADADRRKTGKVSNVNFD